MVPSQSAPRLVAAYPIVRRTDTSELTSFSCFLLSDLWTFKADQNESFCQNKGQAMCIIFIFLSEAAAHTHIRRGAFTYFFFFPFLSWQRTKLKTVAGSCTHLYPRVGYLYVHGALSLLGVQLELCKVPRWSSIGLNKSGVSIMTMRSKWLEEDSVVLGGVSSTNNGSADNRVNKIGNEGRF